MSDLRRREFLAASAVLGVGLLSGGPAFAAPAAPFAQAPLPYPTDALEPAIDKLTMEIHYGKHHAAYVKNLNDAVAGTEYASWTLEQLLTRLAELPEQKRTAIRNNGGGHYNHTLYWRTMGPKSAFQPPSGQLAAAIQASFGSLDSLRDKLLDAGMARFGSGWAWLVAQDGKLAIVSTPNQDTPLSDGHKPLVGVDVWEHAYYLKYQNLRKDYLTAWWGLVNWAEVGKNLEA